MYVYVCTQVRKVYVCVRVREREREREGEREALQRDHTNFSTSRLFLQISDKHSNCDIQYSKRSIQINVGAEKIKPLTSVYNFKSQTYKSGLK